MGLNIRMKIFMDGALVVAPMLSGEIDIGVMTANAGLCNSLYRGAPFRAFLCNGQGRRGRAVTTVVMRSDHYEAGVKTLPDLVRMRGKIAAVGAAGSINQYGLASALKLAGLDPVNDVQWQTSVPQPDIVKQPGRNRSMSPRSPTIWLISPNSRLRRILFSRDEILPIASRDAHRSRRHAASATRHGRSLRHGLHPRRTAVQSGRERPREARGHAQADRQIHTPAR
jgi:hypothetical protein